LTLID